MDDGVLSNRLWEGFGQLQALLGGHAGPGSVIVREGLIASVVPTAPESPTLNAAVAIEAERAPEHIAELRQRYSDAKVRRWGVWLDGRASLAAQALTHAGMVVTTARPGMGADIAGLASHTTDETTDPPTEADLETVGR